MKDGDDGRDAASTPDETPGPVDRTGPLTIASGSTETAEDLIQFGRYSVVPNKRQFLVDGQPSDMGARAFDLLMALIRARGNVLSKYEILGAVWPETHVSEVNLRVHISALRRAFGDDREILKTVPGRGYLLAAASGSNPTADAAPPASEPVPAATGDDRINLRQPLTALVGRQTELAEVERFVSESRLVTLVGSGGIGKTRLAIELGWRLAPLFSNGVRLIDLAPVTDPAAVPSAVATAMGEKLRPTDTSAMGIAHAIGRQRLLLIFDNCEHLVEPVATLINELLARAPSLSVLATSQVTLGVAGEQVYRVNPLALPPAEAAEVAGFGAIALFTGRAQAADRRFELTAENAAAVAEICRRLDGVPLALEMAAARLPLLGIEGLRSGLGDRLKMLRTRPQGYETRYATLRAMAEWSHGLLDAEEKRVFRRLSSFVGSFSLEAAIAVGGTDGDDQWDTIDTLGRLIDKSLVTIEGTEPPRYRLLETLRLYALEQLDASGEREAVAQRHADHFAALLDRAAIDWAHTPNQDWLSRHEPALGDIRSALDWALARGNSTDLPLRLASGASFLWMLLNNVTEARGYYERVAPLVSPDNLSSQALLLLRRRAWSWREDRPKCSALAEELVDLARASGDTIEYANALALAGRMRMLAGNYGGADAAFTDAWAILSKSDQPKMKGQLLNDMAQCAANAKNDLEKSRDLFLQALKIAKETGDNHAQTALQHNLAEIEFRSGAVDEAIRQLKILVERGGTQNPKMRNSWGSLARYLILDGRYAEARHPAEIDLSLSRPEDGPAFVYCLDNWTVLGAIEGRSDEAAQLSGYVDALLAKSGHVANSSEGRCHNRSKELLATSVPPDDLNRLAAEGAAWDGETAISFAREHLDGPGRTASTTSQSH